MRSVSVVTLECTLVDTTLGSVLPQASALIMLAVLHIAGDTIGPANRRVYYLCHTPEVMFLPRFVCWLVCLSISHQD